MQAYYADSNGPVRCSTKIMLSDRIEYERHRVKIVLIPYADRVAPDQYYHLCTQI